MEVIWSGACIAGSSEAAAAEEEEEEEPEEEVMEEEEAAEEEVEEEAEAGSSGVAAWTAAGARESRTHTGTSELTGCSQSSPVPSGRTSMENRPRAGSLPPVETSSNCRARSLARSSDPLVISAGTSSSAASSYSSGTPSP